MKPQVIFIEGVDRAGKGELAKAIHEVTNFKHLIFDRGVYSNMTYALVGGRGSTEYFERMYELESQMSKIDHLVIYVKCSNKELKKRCFATNHEVIDYNTHKLAFETFMTNSPMNIVAIDSTNTSPIEMAQELLNKNLI